MSSDAWKSHNWVETRRVQLNAAPPVIHYRCSRCSRNFVEDPATGEHYAVHVSVFEFQKLSDSVNTQWLATQCPGLPL
jgi:hypothetical protein